jgi:hypothetical protein
MSEVSITRNRDIGTTGTTDCQGSAAPGVSDHKRLSLLPGNSNLTINVISFSVYFYLHLISVVV